MRFEEARHILSAIVEGMPKGYPRPRLVLHESAESLVAFMGDTLESFQAAHGYHPSKVLAMADDERGCVHITLGLLMESAEVIVTVLLHELGHLYYSAKHGGSSAQACSEKLADSFAAKWRKRIRINPALEEK